MKKKISTQVGRVKQHQLFQDKPFVVLSVLNAFALLVLVFWASTHIKPTELSVPIRYTSFANFDVLGKWYQHYELVVVSALVFGINLALALVAHSRNRLLSAVLLSVSLMVSVLSVAMLVGFTAINYGGA